MTQTHVLNSVSADGTGLRVTLEWHEDRYHHRIERVTGNLVTPLAEAPQTAMAADEYEQPVLQQLAVESRGVDRYVALGVGMSGQSHWSMSIETVPESRKIIFDIACRLTEPVANLCSCYQLAAPVTEVAPTHCELNVLGHPCRIEVDTTAQSEILQLKYEADLLQLIPQISPADMPQTVRWRYRVVG
ncbi:MAG: hypothetical protein VX644_07430 [Planctomycetota bacterium]|nr:hypothetical protein [Planctomycetota bacterium]